MLERRSLRAAILRLIEGSGSFAEVALDVFAWQHATNLPYRRYCDRLGHSPDTVVDWREIPAVASDVFRHAALFCGEVSEATHVFRTSGTTSGRRGEHWLRELGVYHTSALRQIDRWLLPDGPRPALMLAPHPSEAPDSSLSSMLGLIGEERARGEVTFAWAQGRLDVEGALAWLSARASAGEPVQVLGTSFAFVHVLDALAERGERLRLPAGSVVMPTGGTKGKTREVHPAEIEDGLVEGLGVARSHVVVEYGMTELGSQFYDPRLGELLAGSPTAPPAVEGTRLIGPPWCRVGAQDALTGRSVEPGEVGLLRFFDASNLDSVLVVQTSDRGRILHASEQGDVFELIGRSPTAPPRGCSLTIEEVMADGNPAELP